MTSNIFQDEACDQNQVAQAVTDAFKHTLTEEHEFTQDQIELYSDFIELIPAINSKAQTGQLTDDEFNDFEDFLNEITDMSLNEIPVTAFQNAESMCEDKSFSDHEDPVDLLGFTAIFAAPYAPPLMARIIEREKACFKLDDCDVKLNFLGETTFKRYAFRLTFKLHDEFVSLPKVRQKRSFLERFWFKAFRDLFAEIDAMNDEKEKRQTIASLKSYLFNEVQSLPIVNTYNSLDFLVSDISFDAFDEGAFEEYDFMIIYESREIVFLSPFDNEETKHALSLLLPNSWTLNKLETIEIVGEENKLTFYKGTFVNAQLTSLLEKAKINL